MNYNIAVSCMNSIANSGRIGYLDGLGVSRMDFDKLVGDRAWLAAERNRLCNCLSSLMNSSVDMLGLPRFDLPAEWVAAAIVVFCSPINYMAACVFMQVKGSAEDLASDMPRPKPVTARQLFSLCCQLLEGNESSNARALFEKNTSLVLKSMDKDKKKGGSNV